MLSFPAAVRIWYCVRPVDMRRSFDGLAHLVREHVGEDPMSGHLFVFRSRGGGAMKVLWWDGDGYALWYKRLEAGAFSLPDGLTGASSVTLTATQLRLILEGIDVASVRRKKRYLVS